MGDFDNRSKPIQADRQEAITIANFAFDNVEGSGNARVAIKMAMVNPIPPINPRPTIWGQVSGVGIDEPPNLIAAQAPRQTPNGLPINKPKLIPRASELVKREEIFVVNSTPALASAKIGITPKVIHGYKACSSFWSGGCIKSVVVFNAWTA